MACWTGVFDLLEVPPGDAISGASWSLSTNATDGFPSLKTSDWYSVLVATSPDPVGVSTRDLGAMLMVQPPQPGRSPLGAGHRRPGGSLGASQGRAGRRACS